MTDRRLCRRAARPIDRAECVAFAATFDAESRVFRHPRSRRSTVRLKFVQNLYCYVELHRHTEALRQFSSYRTIISNSF